MSWALNQPLLLDLRSFEAILLLLSVLVVNGVVRRASATYLEGAMMVGAYLVVAVTYFFREHDQEYGSKAHKMASASAAPLAVCRPTSPQENRNGTLAWSTGASNRTEYSYSSLLLISACSRPAGGRTALGDRVSGDVMPPITPFLCRGIAISLTTTHNLTFVGISWLNVTLSDQNHPAIPSEGMV